MWRVILKNNESSEMYLETIYILEEKYGHAHGVSIAEELGVSKASVSKAMNKLKAEGLVNKKVYGTITLSEKGREICEKIYYKHRIITDFLKCSLEMTTADATENACKMEHIISDSMLRAIEVYFEKCTKV